MFDTILNENQQSIFSIASHKDEDDHNNNIDLNLFSDSYSRTNQDINDYYLSITNEKETKSTTVDNNHSNNHHDNHLRRKENIFLINKEPKLSFRMKAKIDQIKQKDTFIPKKNKSENGVDKDKILQIIYEDIYPSTVNLTPQEKLYLKRVKNRITAQRSRENRKYYINCLKKENERLKKQITERDKILDSLVTIIQSCTNCFERAEGSSLLSHHQTNTLSNTNGSFSIRTMNNEITSRSSHLSYFSLGGLIGIICCICLLATIPVSKYKLSSTIGRTLTYNDDNVNYLKIHYSPNKNFCCAQEINLNKYIANEGYNFLELSTADKCMHKPKTLDMNNSFICKEFISAKLSNELNFDLIYNKDKHNVTLQNENTENKRLSRFKMIIPSFKYQNDFRPYIISTNSSSFENEINKLSQYSYYEVICQINSIQKIISLN